MEDPEKVKTQKKKAPAKAEVPVAPEKAGVPEGIAELLHAYKNGEKLTEEQEPELFGFLADQNILNLVMTPPFSYTKRDYHRLMKEMERREYGMAPRVPRPESELPRLEAKDYRTFIAGLWEDAKNIGTMCVMRWIPRASELGYFDETKNRVDMPKFIEDAAEFYLKYCNKIAELEQEVLANSAMSAMLAECVNKLTQSITLVGAQIDFLETSHPQLKYQLIPMRVLTNIERYNPTEVS